MNNAVGLGAHHSSSECPVTQRSTLKEIVLK